MRTLVSDPTTEAVPLAPPDANATGLACFSAGANRTGLVLPALTRSRLADYVELTKPRIAVMVLFTVAAGFWLARPGQPDLLLLMHTVLATGLLAAGASALNQVLERSTDQQMRRTENRPLPAGRLRPLEGLAFGLVLALAGQVYLALAVPHPLCWLVAAFTLVSYVGLYTPLKRYTTLNTLVGAVSGALPPVIGWTAATGNLTGEAWLLFTVLFLWQVPHFLAIAWLYREDYGRAGLCMLPVIDTAGRLTGRQMVLYCFCLVVVGLLPLSWRAFNTWYLLGAVLLGAGFLTTTLLFARTPSKASARRVLRASLLHLPALLVLLVVG